MSPHVLALTNNCARSLILGVLGLCGSIAQAQSLGLDDLAVKRGFRFGFEISPENLADLQSDFRTTVAHEAGVGTLTHYWHLPGSEQADVDVTPYQLGQPSKIVSGKYDFSRPLSVARFCAEHRIEIHGSPVLWAQDRFTPPWVLENPTKAKVILENHIKKIVGDFGRQVVAMGSRVQVYHVVNEAFDYRGQLLDSYWKTNLGLMRKGSAVPAFVEVAFLTAAKLDPRAKLLYNDYGQEELNSQKFDAIMSMLVEMLARRIPVHGMGWQLHVTAKQVLSSDFPLEQRMNAVAALGLENYITELDIVMDDRNLDGTLPPPPTDGYTQQDFQNQKLAYKKVTEIFARANRRRAMQVWGVYDPQSWLGAERQPLLFDAQFAKKPAYSGVAEALTGNITGTRTICHVMTQGHLMAPDSQRDDSSVRVQVPWQLDLGTREFDLLTLDNPTSTTFTSPTWQIEDLDHDGAYRLQSLSNGQYLQAIHIRGNSSSISTAAYQRDAEEQKWFITPCGGSYFLILNAHSNLFLAARFTRGGVVAGSSSSWLFGLWRIE